MAITRTWDGMKNDGTRANWTDFFLEENEHASSSQMFYQSKTSSVVSSSSHSIKRSDWRIFHFGHRFLPNDIGLSDRKDFLFQISTSTWSASISAKQTEPSSLYFEGE
jgi:hypothetical protein